MFCPFYIRRTQTFFLLGFSLICSSSCAAAQTNAVTPVRTEVDSVLKRHYDAAQEFQSTGELTEAAREYRLFIADALADMALNTVSIDEYSKAAPLFDEALELAPRSPGLIIRYGQAAFAARDLMRARTLAESVLREYPENAKAVEKAHLLLGRVLSQQNHDAAAISQFEAAVAIEPNFENGYALAIAYLDHGDQSSSAKVFAELISGLGDTAELHLDIGRAYLNSDFQQDAIPEFKAAIARNSALAGAHYALAIAYLTVGGDTSLEKAKAELETELRLSPNDAPTHAQQGNIALRQQRYADAEYELKRAAELDATDPNIFFYLGQLYAETNKNNEAVAAFQQSITLTHDPSQNRFQVQKAHYQLARLLIKEGQSDAGRQQMQISSVLLKESLNKDRNRLSGEPGEDTLKTAPINAADAQRSVRQTGSIAALEAFKVRVGPAIADSYNNLGVIAAKLGSPQEALDCFKRAYEWNPKLPGLDDNWGLAAFRSGRYAEAIPALSRSLEAQPSNTAVRSDLAVSLFKTGKFQDDLKVLEPIMTVVDSTPRLGAIYAVSLVKTGQQEAGIVRLRAVERADPHDAEVHDLIGEQSAGLP